MADFCGVAGVFVVGGALFWVLLVGKGAEKKSPFGFGVVFLSETRIGCRVAGFFVA